MPYTPIPGWDGNPWKHPLYTRWSGMRARCNNPKHVAYHNYGGKGVTVCERWNDFGLFVADMGMPPTELHTLDRKKSSGPYEPENCRWATPGEQSRNTCRNNVIRIGCISLTVRDWEIRNGVGRGTYQRRIDLGWDGADAVTQPVQAGKSLSRRHLNHTLELPI